MARAGSGEARLLFGDPKSRVVCTKDGFAFAFVVDDPLPIINDHVKERKKKKYTTFGFKSAKNINSNPAHTTPSHCACQGQERKTEFETTSEVKSGNRLPFLNSLSLPL